MDQKQIPLSLFGGSGFGLEGNQVLHSNPTNRFYQLNKEAVRFVEKEMKQAISLKSDAEIMRYASDQVRIDGLYVELGTGTARSTNFLAALNPSKMIYTFDSFLGLPGDWDRGNIVIPGKLFAQPEGKELPPFLLNVAVKQGWFKDTLPQFVSVQDEPIAFLHVDCDIYESTAEGFEFFGPKMTEGTVLLFDELYNYPNYRNHEYKAFREFLEKYSFSPEYLAFNCFHEQVAVRLLKN